MNPPNQPSQQKEIATCDIQNIKSNYILKIIFDILRRNKALTIIKRSNKTKERLDININDYKNYRGIYSSIEIEIIPYKNESGKFINIKDVERPYFHIYFDNNYEEEIQRKNLSVNDEISKINIIIEHQAKYFNNLFTSCHCIESIYFKKFYRNNIDNMNGMFNLNPALKEINFSNFKTDNVTKMGGMFLGNLGLKELNLSTFNTSNVTNMESMFFGCASLEN